MVGRLGGNAFALLLPETDTAARSVIDKVHKDLLAAMANSGWPVTFSIGVITRSGGHDDVSMLLRDADALMYEVKRETKDGVRYAEEILQSGGKG